MGWIPVTFILVGVALTYFTILWAMTKPHRNKD